MLALRNFGILNNLIFRLWNLIIRGGWALIQGVSCDQIFVSPTSEVLNRPSTYSEVKPTVGEQCTSLLCRQWREEPAPGLKTETYDPCVDSLPPPHPDLRYPPSFILSYLIKRFLSLQDPQLSHQEGCQPQRNFFSCSDRPAWKGFGTGGEEFNGHFLASPPPSSKSTHRQRAATACKFSTHQGLPHPLPAGISLKHMRNTRPQEASLGCQDAQDARMFRMPSPGPY